MKIDGAEAAEAMPLEERTVSPISSRRWQPWLLAAVATIPALWMLTYVRGNNPMQWNDYWDILPRVTNPDGSFAPRNIFRYQNEHPVAIPSVIYWINARLTGGSNIALGYYVVGIVAAQVAVLIHAAKRTTRSSSERLAFFALLFSTLLFAPRSVHNFGLAMSGTAWLSANLFAILTFFVAWRRSVLLAVIPALMATSSYGTGLMVWPALIVMALAERRSRRTVTLLIGATAAIALVYYAAYELPQGVPGTGRTVQEVFSRICQVIGSPFAESGDGDAAGLFGALAICAAGIALRRAWRQGELIARAPWIALLVYAVGGAILIGLSRGGLSPDFGTTSRYVSLGALAWIAIVVLTATGLHNQSRTAIGIVFLSVAAFASGATSIVIIQGTREYSDELAIALRLGAVPGKSDMYFNTASLPLLPVLDHYPFNERFKLDCGYFGRRLDVPTIQAAPTPDGSPGVHGWIDGYLPTRYLNASRIAGWAASDSGRIRCLLFIDADGNVVGAAARAGRRVDVIIQGHPGAFQFHGVVLRPDPPSTYRAVVVTDKGKPFPVLHGMLNSENAP